MDLDKIHDFIHSEKVRTTITKDCAHRFCEDCIETASETVFENRIHKCPICQAKIQKRAVTRDYSFDGMKERFFSFWDSEFKKEPNDQVNLIIETHPNQSKQIKRSIITHSSATGDYLLQIFLYYTWTFYVLHF